MKKSILLAVSLLALNLTPVFGQSPTTLVLSSTTATRDQPPALTKFNLDFPGGTPKELVAAIEKATGKPLNAIIPTEDATLQMPPLKMNDVDVVQLFQAVGAASLKQETRNTSMYYGGGLTPGYNYTTVNTGYGFKTESQISDDSIWYFYVQNPPQPQFTLPLPAKACRFYQLRPYLDSGLTVDDITTAIQTGWKMMGDTSPPEISFHKETKLLIAVGAPDKLEIIDDVLKALQPSPQAPAANFQDRLQRIIKNQSPASTSDAQRLPPLTPPTPLMAPPSAKPPVSQATGQ
jgi:hypothetical protein